MKNAFSIHALTARWRTHKEEAPKAGRVYDLIRSKGESPCCIGTLHLQLLLLLLLLHTWQIVSLRVQHPIFVTFVKHFVAEML